MVFTPLISSILSVLCIETLAVFTWLNKSMRVDKEQDSLNVSQNSKVDLNNLMRRVNDDRKRSKRQNIVLSQN